MCCATAWDALALQGCRWLCRKARPQHPTRAAKHRYLRRTNEGDFPAGLHNPNQHVQPAQVFDLIVGLRTTLTAVPRSAPAQPGFAFFATPAPLADKALRILEIAMTSLTIRPATIADPI